LKFFYPYYTPASAVLRPVPYSNSTEYKFIINLFWQWLTRVTDPRQQGYHAPGKMKNNIH